jgi:hypothetical protein
MGACEGGSIGAGEGGSIGAGEGGSIGAGEGGSMCSLSLSSSFRLGRRW